MALNQKLGYRVNDSSGTTAPAINLPGVLNDLSRDYAGAKAQRQQRYVEGRRLMQDAMAQFAPGGAFEQAGMASYAQGKKEALAGGMQNLVSSGLAGTSNPMAMNTAYERNVGNPFRLNLAAEGSGRLASAMTNAANYVAGFPDIYADAGTLAHVATGGFGALSNDWQAVQAINARNSAQTAQNSANSPMPSLARSGYSSSNLGSPFSGFSFGGGGNGGGSYGGYSSFGGGSYGGGGSYSPEMDWSDASFGSSDQWLKDTYGEFGVPSVEDELSSPDYLSNKMNEAMGGAASSGASPIGPVQGGPPTTAKEALSLHKWKKAKGITGNATEADIKAWRAYYGK